MNWMRFILATVGGFIALVVVGLLWYTVVFASFYGDAILKTLQAATIMIIVVDILRALILAYVYPIGYKGGTPWLEGIRFGVVMGLVAGLPTGFFLSAFGQPMNVAGMQLVFHVVQGAVLGVVVALIYGSAAKSA
jgi:hypothetical protein